MDLGLAGRTAIVCASSRGLGRACATSLARAGVKVTINGRSEDTVAATAAAVARETGGDVVPVVADVSSADGQAALLAAMPEPDILINNNIGPPLRDYRDLDRAAMLDGVVQNMVTPIELIQAVIDPMIARKFGRIVNITSATVKMPVVGLDLSSAARAGLTAFIAGVARDVAAHNVTINNMLPSVFETDRLHSAIDSTAKMTGTSRDDVTKSMMATIPAGRPGTPEEFGDVCAFLCSQQAGYMTGQNFLLDGGRFPSAF